MTVLVTLVMYGSDMHVHLLICNDGGHSFGVKCGTLKRAPPVQLAAPPMGALSQHYSIPKYSVSGVVETAS